jgi:hypothetical protein
VKKHQEKMEPAIHSMRAWRKEPIW